MKSQLVVVEPFGQRSQKRPIQVPDGPLHEPLDTVSVLPTCGVPEIEPAEVTRRLSACAGTAKASAAAMPTPKL
jgi:hypothetical protein